MFSSFCQEEKLYNRRIFIMLILLGTNKDKEKVYHNFALPHQTDLAIVGMKGTGKSNLLSIIINQTTTSKVPTYIIDPNNEIYFQSATTISNQQEISDFLSNSCNHNKDRFIIIDEVASILSGRENQSNREAISRILSLGRHKGIKIILATQIPDYRSFGSSFIIQKNISSWCYFQLPVSNLCSYDCSKLHVGTAIYTSPRIREILTPINKSAMTIHIPKYEILKSPLLEELEKHFLPDIAKKILSIPNPSQHQIRKLGIGGEKSRLAMSIINNSQSTISNNSVSNLSENESKTQTRTDCRQELTH